VAALLFLHSFCIHSNSLQTHTHPQRADVRREYPLADRSLSLSLYIYIWCVVVSLLSLSFSLSPARNLFSERIFPSLAVVLLLLFRNDDDDDDDRRRVFIASRLTSTLSLFCSVSSVCDINRPGKESILFFAEFSTSARTDKPISCGRRSNTTRIDFSCRKTNTRIQLGLGFLRKARRRDRRRSSRDEGLTF
jgi:hypothetical protein